MILSQTNSFLKAATFFQLISCSLCLSTNSISVTTQTKPPKHHKTYKLSIPLNKSKPKPNNIFEKLNELWNDPRPITSVLSKNDRSNVGTIIQETNDEKNIPYCIISDEFEVESQKFQVLLYPRGRFVSGKVRNENNDILSGPASAYLRYLPTVYGDEVDITWTLQLRDRRTLQPLQIVTSGGLPKSNTTWSAAMTFCAENEAIESVGRATDWGSSTWFANDVCNALDHLEAYLEIGIFESRNDESSFAWPLFSKGGIGSVIRAATQPSTTIGRDFRAGEVIVPIDTEADENDNATRRDQLKSSFIYPGVDYRIMTMCDKDGNAIFTTKSLPENERNLARLALRPCGWKLQQQLWKRDGMTQDWPVEIEASLLSSNVLTRFNPGSAVPRITTAFKGDVVAYVLALILAISPIPVALIGRNVVSLYAIPSASMEPTLLKGDVLLVEKFPRIYDRIDKGDVVLFKPPQSLTDIITGNGGSPISSTSLFVKRVVALPGDKDILMDDDTKDVKINNEPAVGPNRNLCEDEPLRLIDRLLVNGKGKQLSTLTENEVFVLGDCKAVSVDSRVFGTLPKDNLVGRPLARIWPLDRLSSGPF
mmetsp:Transcript_32879/g.38282  ORF Transcript_32879/g.38282 Transcript_32879/m.38282 type:complete len:594 (-) Transcript_32879:413-2194(-)